MSFTELGLQHSYSSERDNLVADFYVPVLKQAITYDRIAGYFSSTSLVAAAEGFAMFVGKNRGHLRYIINIQLSPEDYDQIAQGVTGPEEIIAHRLSGDIDALKDECLYNHVRALGWLIVNGYLEVRVGYVKEKTASHAILHQKVGILTDAHGNTISFSGSNNESASGWLHNSEKFKVFMSWEPQAAPYIQQDADEFEELWNDRAAVTRVIPFPKAVEESLIRLAPHSSMEVEALANLLGVEETRSVKLRGYQHEAIEAWLAADGRGIFEMATGTGKTFTALGAIEKLLKREPRLVVVISCPFLHLSTQWQHSLEAMGFDLPILMASSLDPKWRDKVYGTILDVRLGRLKQFFILTTHETVSSEKFIDLMRESHLPLCLIGDEVHGMGSTTHLDALIPEYRYRLGLSATPQRYYDEVGTAHLLGFFGGTVYTFSLHDAITQINPDTGETFLVPYEYHPIIVELADEDTEEYFELSGRIAILANKPNPTRKDLEVLEQLLRKRADIIKNSTEKYPAFARLIHDLKASGNLYHTLVYCSPQQIREAQALIRQEGGVIQHRFTFEEDATRKQAKYGDRTEREYLLYNFDIENYHLLVAIRCLDEGVDVPSTRNAILLSSSGNPKEYIQRRGRVLRRYPGKEKAVIYDVTALPNPLYTGGSNETIRSLIEQQLVRLKEFGKDSLNEDDVNTQIYKIREKYHI